MGKKEDRSSFNAKINNFNIEKEDIFSYYKKELIYHVENFAEVINHKREVIVKNVIDDLENRQFRSKSFKRKILILTAYLIAIVAAEIVTAHYNVEYGLAMHTIILFALVINSSIYQSTGFSYLLRSMMILPMIRIIGLSIPIMQIKPLYWFPIIAIPLFAASFILIRSQKLTRKKMGLVLGNVPLQLTIALSGVILGFIEYLILKPQPLISTFSMETVLFASIILIVSTGFAEELLFRGILQKNAENVLGKAIGLLYVSILFTALHIEWNSTLDIVFVFCVAIFYGYTFQKTKSLLGVTLSHGISNSFLFLVVPFIFPALLPYL